MCVCGCNPEDVARISRKRPNGGDVGRTVGKKAKRLARAASCCWHELFIIYFNWICLMHLFYFIHPLYIYFVCFQSLVKFITVMHLWSIIKFFCATYMCRVGLYGVSGCYLNGYNRYLWVFIALSTWEEQIL